MQRTLRFFNILLFVGYSILFASCGIENYIYLTPVTAITKTADTISVTLPLFSDQPVDYFSGYMIYYKIYTSTNNLTSSIESSNFGDINSSMSTDYSKLSPYISTDSFNSINMYVFFNSIGFSQLQLYNTDINNLLKTINNFKLQKNQFELDLENSNSSNSYTLIRINKEAFKYKTDISGDDVVVIDNHSTAYAMFVIFTYGVDEYGSPIFSRPSLLGVLQLPNSE